MAASQEFEQSNSSQVKQIETQLLRLGSVESNEGLEKGWRTADVVQKSSSSSSLSKQVIAKTVRSQSTQNVANSSMATQNVANLSISSENVANTSISTQNSQLEVRLVGKDNVAKQLIVVLEEAWEVVNAEVTMRRSSVAKKDQKFKISEFVERREEVTDGIWSTRVEEMKTARDFSESTNETLEMKTFESQEEVQNNEFSQKRSIETRKASQTFSEAIRESQERIFKIEETKKTEDIGQVEAEELVGKTLRQKSSLGDVANLQEQGEEEVNTDGTFGSITAPGPAEGFASTKFLEERKSRAQLTKQASIEVFQSSEHKLRRNEEHGISSVKHRSSSRESVKLAGRTPLSREASLEGRFTVPDSWSSIEHRLRTPSVDSAALRVRQPSEECVLGMWNTRKGEETRKTLPTKSTEKDGAQLATKASMNVSSETNLALSQDELLEGGKKIFGEQLRQIISAEFGIASDSLDKFLELMPKLHWESITLPEKERRKIAINIRALCPVHYDALSIVGRIQAPPTAEDGAEIVFKEVRGFNIAVHLKECLETAILQNEEFSNITPKEQTIFSSLLATMVSCDLTALASTHVENETNMDYHRRPAPREVQKVLRTASTTKIDNRFTETREEMVHGIWSSDSFVEGVSGKILQRSKSTESVQLKARASVERSCSKDAQLAREVREGSSTTIGFSLSEEVKRRLSIDEQTKSAVLSRGEAVRSQWKSFDTPREARASSTVRELGKADVETGGVLGQLSSPLPEYAGAEKKIQEKNFVGVSSRMSASREVLQNQEQTFERKNSVHETFKKIDTSSVQTATLRGKAPVDQEISTDKAFGSQESQKNVEQLRKAALTEHAFIDAQETSETTATGLWRTSSNAEASTGFFLQKTLSTQSLDKHLAAPISTTVDVSEDLTGEGSEIRAATFSEKSTDRLTKNFGISQSEAVHRFDGPNEAGEGKILLGEKRVNSAVGNVFEQSVQSLKFGGTFGELEAPMQQEEDVEQVFRERRLVRTSSVVREPSEESLNQTEFLRRSDSFDSSARRTLSMKNRERASLSRKASTERRTSYDAMMAKVPRTDSVERIHQDSRRGYASMSATESQTESAFGEWSTKASADGAKQIVKSKPTADEKTSFNAKNLPPRDEESFALWSTSLPESAIVTLREHLTETDQFKLDTNQQNVSTEDLVVKLERVNSVSKATGLMKATSDVEVDRMFGIETTSSGTSLEKRAQIESWISSLPDKTTADEAFADVQEFLESETTIGGSAGRIEAPAEQYLDSSIEMKHKMSVSVNHQMAASKTEQIEKPFNLESTKGLQEGVTKDFSDKGHASEDLKTAWHETAADASLSFDTESGVARVDNKIPRTEQETKKLRESREEEIVGLWNTSSQGELADKTMGLKTKAEKMSLETMAATETENEITAGLNRSPSQEVNEKIPSKTLEEASAEFAISAGSCETSIKREDDENQTQRTFRDSKSEEARRNLHEFGKADASMGFAADSLTSPQPASEQAEKILIETRHLRGSLTGRATTTVDTVQDSNISRQDEFSAEASLTKQVPRADSAVKETKQAESNTVRTESVKHLDESHGSTTATLQAGRQEESMKSLRESKKEEIVGLWRTSSHGELTEKTLPENVDAEQLKLWTKAPVEETAAMTAGFKNEADGEVSGKLDFKTTDAADAKFGIVVGSCEKSMQKKVHENEAQKVLKDSRNEEAKRLLHEFGEAEAGMGFTADNLTSPQPAFEQAEKILAEKRQVSGSLTGKASTTVDAVQDSDVSRQGDFSAEASLTKQVPRAESVIKETKQPESNIIQTQSTKNMAESQDSTTISLKSQNQEKTVKSTFESKEEEVVGLWRTSSRGELTQKTLPENVDAEQLKLMTKAPVEETAAMTAGLQRDATEEAFERFSLRMSEGIEAQFGIAAGVCDASMQKDTLENRTQGILKDSKNEEARRNLHEFGKADASMGFVANDLTSPQPAFEQTEKVLIEKRHLSSSLTGKATTTVDAIQDSDVCRQGDFSAEASLLKQVPRAEKASKETRQAEFETVETQSTKHLAGTQDSTAISLKSRNQEESTRSLLESREEEIVGLWRTSSHGELTEKTLPVNANAEQLKLTAKAPIEETSGISAGLQKNNQEEVSGKIVSRILEGTDGKFAIAVGACESTMTKEDDSNDAETVLKKVSEGQASQKVCEFGKTEAGMGFVADSLTSPQPAFEQTEKILAEKRQISSSLTGVATTIVDAVQDSNMSRQGEFSAEASLTKQVPRADSAVKGTKQAESNTVGTESVKHLEESRESTTATLQAGRQEKSVTNLRETKEEEIVGLWRTSSHGELAHKTLPENAETEKIHLLTKAAEETSTGVSTGLEKTATEEVSGKMAFKTTGAADAKFGIAAGACESSMQKDADENQTQRILKDSKSEEAKRNLHEFGKAEAGMGFTADSLTSPQPAFEQTEKTLTEKRQISGSLTGKATTTVDAVQDSNISRQGELSAEASFSKQVPRAESVNKDTRQSEVMEVGTESTKKTLESHDSTEILLKLGNHEKSVTSMRESKEEEIVGLWRTSSRGELTETVLTENTNPEQLHLRTKAAAEATTGISSGLQRRPVEGVEGTVAFQTLEGAEAKFGISTEAFKTSMQREESTKNAQTILKASKREDASQKIHEFGQVDAGLGFVADSLVSPQEAREQTESVLIEKRNFSSSLTSQATTTTDAVNESDVKRENSEGSASMTKQMPRAESVSKDTKQSEFETVETRSAKHLAESQDSTSISLKSRNQEESTRSLIESREEEIVGLWRTSSRGELAQKTLPENFDAEKLQLSTKAASEAMAGVSAGLQKAPTEQVAGKMSLRTSEETEAKFGIASESYETSMKKAESSNNVQTLLKDSTGADTSKKVYEFGKADAGLGFVADSLVSPQPAFEHAEGVILDKRNISSSLTGKATTTVDVVQDSDISHHGVFSAEAHLTKRDIRAESVAKETKQSEFNTIETNTTKQALDSQGSTATTLQAARQEKSETIVYESKEEEIVGLWRTSSHGQLAQKTLPENAETEKIHLLTKAAEETSTGVCTGLVKTATEEVSGKMAFKTTDAADANFGIAAGACESSMQKDADENQTQRILKDSKSEEAKRNLHEFGKAEAGMGFTADSLTSPQPAFGQTEKTLTEKRQISGSLTGKGSTTVDAVQDSNIVHQSDFSCRSFFDKTSLQGRICSQRY
ncbi:unnamed protein product [Caenorhabditis auriculariae]|uniref:Uncharacterized protein n=1 Tax=Caenorhabditis auriculariae TaxID=2777116 RepID=A0A8S1HVI1_9PELO|nr:unnamed protein product [Caenorhabditis auriculariae]